ncbi:MAG: hypothetical protein L3J79_07155 [Candidatus Marinimicrobia bacterium]|nr:hypothetical protein [Candidatus Neomarinimicrobiota bacterium]
MTAADEAHVNLTVGQIIVIADIRLYSAALAALTGGFLNDTAQSIILTVDPVAPPGLLPDYLTVIVIFISLKVAAVGQVGDKK